MTETTDGGPAFAHGNPTDGGSSGMSLRDWFASMATVGMLASPHLRGDPTADHGDFANLAYRIADAMLRARATPPDLPA